MKISVSMLLTFVCALGYTQPGRTADTLCDAPAACDAPVESKTSIPCDPTAQLGSILAKPCCDGGSLLSAPATQSCDCVPCSAPGCTALSCDTCATSSGTSGCCDLPSCGIEECGTCCQPAPPCCYDQWSVLAEAMFLRRSDASPGRLIYGQNTGEDIVRREDLDFDHVAVPRLQLMRQYCCCWGWDVSFFGTDAWNSTRRGGGDVSPVLAGPGLDFGSTAPGLIYQADYGTELYSAEANLRYRCHECVTLVAGFRWIELGDTLHAYSVAPSVVDFYTLDANNQMYGFQLGADATLLEMGNRFRLTSITRAGVLANHVDYTASSPLLGGPGTVSRVFAEDDTTAFLGELGLRGAFSLTDKLAVVAGYQLLWLDGVTLAADRLDSTSLLAPGAATLGQETVFFHGATIGLQATF